jgi:hypothetical protein
MSPEQLAEAREPLSPEQLAEREKFKKRLKGLREMNKMLSASQRELRLQGKPSKGTVHKSTYAALKITAILNMMRVLKGLSLFYIPPDSTTAVPIHRVRPERIDAYMEIEREINTLLRFQENTGLSVGAAVVGRMTSKESNLKPKEE